MKEKTRGGAAAVVVDDVKQSRVEASKRPRFGMLWIFLDSTGKG